MLNAIIYKSYKTTVKCSNTSLPLTYQEKNIQIHEMPLTGIGEWLCQQPAY